MSKIPTSKFLKNFPSYTSLVISIKENKEWKKINVFLKYGEYWTSIYNSRQSIKNSIVPKYLKYIIDDVEEYIIEVNPNRYTEGNEPIHIFTETTYYNSTRNNTKFLKGYRTHISKKPTIQVNVKDMF